jgi:hypothetical protein
MAARLANVLFWLGVIVAVGYVARVLFDAWGRDVADAVLIFAVSTITVAAGWASRYILGASPRLDHQ